MDRSQTLRRIRDETFIMLGTFLLSIGAALLTERIESSGLCIGMSIVLLLTAMFCLLGIQDKRKGALLCCLLNALAGGCIVGWLYADEKLPIGVLPIAMALCVVAGLFALAWIACTCKYGGGFLYVVFVMTAVGTFMVFLGGADSGDSPAMLFAFLMLILFAPHLVCAFVVANSQRSVLVCHAYAGFSALALLFFAVAVLLWEDGMESLLDGLLNAGGSSRNENKRKLNTDETIQKGRGASDDR